jgi:hypothetical protein
MPSRQTENVRRHRNRQRAQGLRPVQFWLPDTGAPEFAAQVTHDIALLAKLDPEDEAMLDQFERWGAETLVDWPPPEVKLPGPE